MRLTALLLTSIALFAQDPVSVIEQVTELERSGRFAEAESLALALLKRSDRDAETQSLALNELGVICQALDRRDEAERHYIRGMRLLAGDGPHQPARLARITMNLASLYVEAGRFAEAERLQAETRMGDLQTDPERSHLRGLTAAIRTARGDYDEAERLYLEHLTFVRSQPETDRRTEEATTLNNLGTIALQKHNWSLAVDRLRSAVELWRNAVSASHPSLSRAIGNLGVAYMKSGQPHQAAEAFGEAVGLADQSVGAGHPLTISMRFAWSEALAKSGRKAEAKQIKRAATLAQADAARPVSGYTVDVSSLRK